MKTQLLTLTRLDRQYKKRYDSNTSHAEKVLFFFKDKESFLNKHRDFFKDKKSKKLYQHIV
ncbi:hypothetical protein [Virgibacillus proomii]|uniref:hypothetical protein n=1 Tax=Virgibacillus proomii TaxID=84407 RepID=UPI001C0FEBAD|nr:hypothetical protein [Virgibacillus proomii]MBU5266086.1 hypothetical protein [Virgibacillus proomii]